ncbi:hypothetical protein ACOSQ3_028861 [Xanthoceras sorbifolium]
MTMERGTLPPSGDSSSGSKVESKSEQMLRLIGLVASWTGGGGWIKVNVDDSKHSGLESISIGRVLEMPRRPTAEKEYGSVLETELWGVFERLTIAWKQGSKM